VAEVIVSPLGERNYKVGHHRFFDDLVNMCLVTACYTATFLTYRGRPGRFKSGEGVAFPGFGGRLARDLSFHPDQLLSTFVGDNEPTGLTLIEYPLTSTSPLRKEALMVSLAMQAFFVRYYESMADQIADAYGSRAQWQRWPPVLRFGKIVRDAFAHNGLVHINGQNPPPSTVWWGVDYGPSQNGQRVLYGDLALADLVVLMEEMDDAIPR
jgi:hypothetical protein